MGKLHAEWRVAPPISRAAAFVGAQQREGMWREMLLQGEGVTERISLSSAWATEQCNARWGRLVASRQMLCIEALLRS